MKSRTKEGDTKTSNRKNWALPNQEISYNEFLKSIESAEQGPFMSVDEFKKKFYQWRKEKYGL